MKILLATDGSHGAQIAVDKIARSFYPPKTQVRVVSAVNYDAPLVNEPGGLTHEYFAELENHEYLRAKDIVEEAATKIRGRNPELQITTAVLASSPKRAIIEEAERWQPDIIVVGSHGLSRWERAFIGSVSQAVAAQAPCSVEIVRQTWGKSKI